MTRRPAPDPALLEGLNLLREPEPLPGSLDFNVELRAVLAQAIKESPKSRAIIAAEMTDLTGAEITPSMLNAWTAESKEDHRFPLCHLPAFEIVTASSRVTIWLGRRRGFCPLFGKEAVFAEIAKLEQQADEARQRADALRRAARGKC